MRKYPVKELISSQSITQKLISKIKTLNINPENNVVTIMTKFLKVKKYKEELPTYLVKPLYCPEKEYINRPIKVK